MDDANRAARSEIMSLIERHDLARAAERYESLLERDGDASFPEPQQLDLANQLHTQQSWTAAARAYEILLDRFPGSSSAEEVTLLLGAIYARRLDRPARARELLQRVVERLREPAQRALAERLLAEIAT
jgi:outer membrane protein assembly factor BamD (BamD/ComL family)